MSVAAQTSVRATAQHPSLSGTLAGTLQVVGNDLEFKAGDVEVALPLSGLQLEAGGHNNEQLFFRHPSQPEWFISTGDHSIAATLGAHGSDLREQLSKAVKRKATSSRLLVVTAIFVGTLALFVVLLFALKSTLAGFAANRLPLSWEAQFGDAVFESVKAQSKIVDDPKWSAQFEAVTTRLLRGLTNSEYTFKFHVVEAEDVNAFAIPGGHIVVHTGLLKAVDRPEQLAGVIAHEMAHVTERHSLRNLVESAGLALVVQTLFGDASALIAVASGGSEFLLRQKFSRDVEREADDVGWNYLLAANVDPRGAIEFFGKLQKEMEKNAAASAVDGRFNLVSTHPATPERIARLEAKWNALARTNGFEPIVQSLGSTAPVGP
jgi:beta-barrel assembly-enhancing protease